MEPATVDGLLDHIHARIRDLPEVNTAAKLRALAGRIEAAVKQQGNVNEAATQLEKAANAALDGDPWVLLHRAVAELVSALNNDPA